jgi:hypothetical protein
MLSVIFVFQLLDKQVKVIVRTNVKEQNSVKLTQEAWVKGILVKPDGSVRTFDFGRPVGQNGETS